MNDKNEQNPKTKQGRILRAKDIIPGKEYQDIRESGSQDFDIPQFNLANDIMSVQRQQNTIRRKGPEIAEYTEKKAEQRTKKMGWRLAGGIEMLRDSIIAEIVARDIERLCAGH
jgi:hypothetical protein